ncbi:MAG: hypothetical protein EPO16_05570 [Dehalococcoidia bacterium]|nr:MAG: hypothetical protein EPO16_05570 [Dehalococcoidia bacterium]
MSRTLRSLLAASTVALLLAACGGDKEAAPTSSTGGTDSPAPAGKSTGAPAGAPAGAAAGVAAALGGGFCGEWGALAAQSAKLTAPGGTPGSLKESFDATNAYMKALADKAPAEIKGDFQLYAKFWSDYSAVMAKANYDMMKAATDPEMQKALEAMADPKLDKAGANISAWVEKNCAAGR